MPSPPRPAVASRYWQVTVKSGVFHEHVLRVGHFAVVLEKPAAAGAVDRLRGLHPQDPMHQVQRMLAQVGRLPAGVIPEPAKMIDGAIGIVGPLGAGPRNMS